MLKYPFKPIWPYILKIVGLAGFSGTGLGKQMSVDLWVQGHPGEQNEFQYRCRYRYGYRYRLIYSETCLEETKNCSVDLMFYFVLHWKRAVLQRPVTACVFLRWRLWKRKNHWDSISCWVKSERWVYSWAIHLPCISHPWCQVCFLPSTYHLSLSSFNLILCLFSVSFLFLFFFLCVCGMLTRVYVPMSLCVGVFVSIWG